MLERGAWREERLSSEDESGELERSLLAMLSEGKDCQFGCSVASEDERVDLQLFISLPHLLLAPNRLHLARYLLELTGKCRMELQDESIVFRREGDLVDRDGWSRRSERK